MLGVDFMSCICGVVECRYWIGVKCNSAVFIVLFDIWLLLWGLNAGRFEVDAVVGLFNALFAIVLCGMDLFCGLCCLRVVWLCFSVVFCVECFVGCMVGVWFYECLCLRLLVVCYCGRLMRLD